MPIPLSAEWLATLRAFASEDGALLYVIQTTRGPAPIWADDINATKTDDELRELVRETLA